MIDKTVHKGLYISSMKILEVFSILLLKESTKNEARERKIH